MATVWAGQAQSEYVNPLVGTDGHGHTFPGALLPFGAVQLSPDTRLEGWDGCSAYHYSDNRIYGFSHTHLSGTGCSDYGDILIMPFYNKVYTDNEKYSATFSHDNETAQAGYYAVNLNNGIRAELTTGKWVGMHRYTFPTGKNNKGIIIDLTHRDKTLASGITRKGDEIIGYRRSEAWNPDQYCAFSLVASEPIEKVAYYKDDQLVTESEINGENCKAIIYFDNNVEQVILKVAISAVDMEGAQNNQQEIADFNFDRVHREATQTWDQELSKIKVETNDQEALKIFYTALYHCFTSPYLYSDLDGRYRGQDGKIHETGSMHNMYTVFSLWDTYRGLHPLLNIIDRKRTADFLYTFIQHYRQGTMLPVWELSAHETWCMIGYHSVPVILDAFIKGIHPYDEHEMLQAMVHSAKLNKLGRTEYAHYGYVPGDADNESVSKTLEYAFDDWCIAEFARLIGNKEIYNEFTDRAISYRNLIDPDGFMHAKINGAFVTPFDPTEVNNFYTEANCWQYSTYVPHDIRNYIYQMGGEETFERFLDDFFYSSSTMTGRNQADITGIIGQYAHGNEPSHHAIYLYNHVQRYDKTVELAHRIMTELYSSQPDGLCGNEDCGQMSAWYVLSSLGFYPICPGNNQYDLGYPVFDKATIQLENGKQIVIRKTGHGDHVADVTINGARPTDQWMRFHFDDIKNGGEIVFTMTDQSTNNSIGQSTTPSYEIYKPATPYFSLDKVSISEPTSVEILTYRPRNPQIENRQDFWAETVVYYTLDGSTPTPTQGTLYTQPIVVDSNMTIKAIAYHPSLGSSNVAEAHYTLFVKDKSLTYRTEPASQYYAGGEDGLIDCIRGTENWRVGNWQGFSGDFEAVIDLLSLRPVSEVSIGCLEDVRAWIFFPKSAEVQISDDGTHYKPFGTVQGIPSEKSEEPKLHTFSITGNATGRYLKIKVINYGPLPQWHISAGENAWLFMDEITVK